MLVNDDGLMLIGLEVIVISELAGIGAAETVGFPDLVPRCPEGLKLLF